MDYKCKREDREKIEKIENRTERRQRTEAVRLQMCMIMGEYVPHYGMLLRTPVWGRKGGEMGVTDYWSYGLVLSHPL